MVHLSELIPCLTSLKELHITHNTATGKWGDVGFLKVLQQLYHSNVTSLDITETGVVKLLDSPHDYMSALRCLIHPSSGKLEHLGVGDYGSTGEDKLVDLLSAPSSLKSLHLVTENIPSHAVYLKSNTNLTRLELHSVFLGIPEDQIPALIDIVNCNRTLKVLVLTKFKTGGEGWIDHLRPLISAVHKNKSLQRIEIRTARDYTSPKNISHYMTTHHKELTVDSRITWKE
jgi:hypothetical protein